LKTCCKGIIYGTLLLVMFAVMPTPGFVPGTGASMAMAAETTAKATDATAATDASADKTADAAKTPAYPPAPKLTADDYPTLPFVNGRIVVWIVAQLHLWFAAFVLAVPIFVFIIEVIGMKTRDQRYDNMAHEFIKVSLTAYSLTSIIGGLLAFSLLIFYPQVLGYLTTIFKKSMFAYALLFFAENAVLYPYYYGWDWLQGGNRKWVHLTLGLLLNAVGTMMMFQTNAWTTFMMSPAAVNSAGVFNGDVWAAMHNYLWKPLNIHRFVANIAYGGSVVGAYAAFKFLSATNKESRAHYDWMGYNANIIAISALIPLPFAGYYLTAEIYSYSQQMGITLMGGVFAWLFIIQAVLIGALFLSANYYLWCGMGRSDGANRYFPYLKYLAIVITAAFMVWMTPHTLVLTNAELKSLGGPYHPYLGKFGIMPAKNTAVNLMILTTGLSFLLYRRCNKIATASWANIGNSAIAALFLAGVCNILTLGVYYGYFTNTVYKVAASIPQVLTTAVVIITALTVDTFMYKGSKEVAPLHWGRIPNRSQYALFLLAVAFTWLMGLMGYIRSGIRQHWHVVGIFRDNSVNAFTPDLAFAANTVSYATILFMAMVIFVFWLASVSGRKSDASKYWMGQQS